MAHRVWKISSSLTPSGVAMSVPKSEEGGGENKGEDAVVLVGNQQRIRSSKMKNEVRRAR